MTPGTTGAPIGFRVRLVISMNGTSIGIFGAGAMKYSNLAPSHYKVKSCRSC